MQCWWSLLLHPSWQLVKLSPSTISSRHMGHTSSSSRAWVNNPPRPDVPGVDGGVLLWPLDREFFDWPLVSFCKHDVTRAWYLESKFSALKKKSQQKKDVKPLSIGISVLMKEKISPALTRRRDLTSKFFNFKVHNKGSFSFSLKTLNITKRRWTQCGLVQVQLWE